MLLLLLLLMLVLFNGQACLEAAVQQLTNQYSHLPEKMVRLMACCQLFVIVVVVVVVSSN
jgi:hypothetical protein